MSEPAPRNAILASPSIAQPGELDRLNTILENAGLGRPLGPPERTTPVVAELPVSGDPEHVVAALHRVLPEGEDIDVSHEYAVDTVDPDGKTKLHPPPTESLSAFGLKSGHGTVTWTPLAQYEAPQQPSWPPPPSPFRPPVVVVLDSGVRQHKWLPHNSDPSFFCSPTPPPKYHLPVADPGPQDGKFGAYWGHATFLAGLIRMTAPHAQVVSLRLMSNDGKVRSGDVVSALGWLHDEYIGPEHRVDVVLMAFGQRQKAGEADQRRVKGWIDKLVDGKGVQFVASAGNNNSKTPTFPACLESVISVGAGTSEEHRERYSNHGPWVRQWRPGTHVSLMPLTQPGPGASENGNGFAVWSGTSFSAAIRAGELAEDRASSESQRPVVANPRATA